MTNPKPNAETYRIRSLIYLAARNLPEARLEIQKALELEPRWENIQFTAAVVDYFSALSPAILPTQPVAWPEPVDWAYVKRDDESLTRLRKAADVFQTIASGVEKTSEERQNLTSWRLACLVLLPYLVRAAHQSAHCTSSRRAKLARIAIRSRLAERKIGLVRQSTVAVLANDWERQEKAVEYCRGVLQSDPTHHPAIIWAVARNFDVELDPSEAALEKAVEEGPTSIIQILSLVGCYFASRRAEKAIRLLARTKSAFEEHKANALWIYWYVQSLVFKGDFDAAIEVINTADPELDLRTARSVVLGALAEQSGDWQALSEYLDQSYETVGDPNLLFENCRLMAQKQNWAYVATHANQLVEEIGTGEALRLAAIATYNTKRYDLCLRLLNENQKLFGYKLPIELRRLRVSCLHNLGILPDAIAEAEALAREEATIEGLLSLAQLYFEAGDFQGLVVVARQLTSHSGLPVHAALEIARLIQWEDQRLAVSLWRRAALRDLPDALVGQALTMGYQLGLDSELKPLVARMIELGQQGLGGIQVATIQDFIPFIRQHREQEAELNEIYRNGVVPIHLVAEKLNLPLVELYHGFSTGFEAVSDPVRQHPLLVRHGGRPLVPGFPEGASRWRLNIDITAILLAEHLDILDQVEDAFKPLRVPTSLIPALAQMRERVAHHQPARIQACQQIIELSGREAIKIVEAVLPRNYANASLVSELGEEFAALFESARSHGGYLVSFLPLQKRDLSGPPSSLPTEAGQYLVNCRAIVEALREHGPLSDTEYLAALDNLGDEACRVMTESIPGKGAPLYCRESVLEVLVGAGLLHTVCKQFEVYIERQEFDRARAELREHERRSTVVEWIGRLIDRIGRGIDGGTYEVIRASLSGESIVEETGAENPSLSCILTLLKFESQLEDVIWADDRYVNGFLRRDTVPIVGINEVLKALVSLGVLQVDAYYSKLSRLRAGNARFIPVESDEILHYLRHARCDRGRVIETTDLNTLRRYVAGCLLQGSILQQPPLPEGSPNENGEIAFVLSLASAVSSAIVGLWVDETTSESERLARAEWILENLYLNHLALRNLTSLEKPGQDGRYLVGISLTQLISQAIVLDPSHAGDESSTRRKYFEWLFYRVLQRRFARDPHLLEVVVELLKSLLLDQESVMQESGVEPSAVLWFLQSLYEELPRPIRDELWLDIDLMAKIGIKPVYAINIGDLSFESDEFFAAVGEAVNGRMTTITALGLDQDLVFEPWSEERPRGAFSFVHPATGERQFFANEDFELLLDSPTQREEALRRNRHWFDCPQDVFDQATAGIVSMEEPRKRIEKAKEWRESSAAVFYDELYHKLRDRKAFEFADLRLPDANGLLRHLRLPSSIGAHEQFRDALSVATRVLVEEEGLVPTINRLAGLPLPFPMTLIEAVEALPHEKKRSLIGSLVRTAGSPISRIHLVHLLMRCGTEGSSFWRLARHITSKLLGLTGFEELVAFLAMLKWVSDEFSQGADTKDWPSHLRLAISWTHAHRLFVTFMYLGTPISWLQRVFDQANLRLIPEAFTRDSNSWFDVSHPRRVAPVAFLTSGLSYALGKNGAGLVDEELGARLNSLAFRDLEGKRLPVPSLLRDHSRASNRLLSFLGGDLGEEASSFDVPPV